MLVAAVAVPATAQAGPRDGDLVTAVTQYLSGENAVTVDAPTDQGGTRNKRTVSDAVIATTQFKADKVRREEARRQEAELNRLGEVHFRDSSTSVELLSAESPTPDQRVLGVEETSSYTFADDSAEPYTYKLMHRVTFQRSGNDWALAAIATDDPLGLNERAPRPPKQFEESKRLTLQFLNEADAGQQTRDEANAEKARLDKQVGATAPGSGDSQARVANTCYSCAADWAKKYAVAPPAVDYSRDTNDCTTFVSFAMNHGGWPEVTGFYSSSGAWWYNCDWCVPRHSYAWGGAQNFKTFVANSGRVAFLSNVWYVGLADIIQYDVKNYGGTGTADHTMIVTGFDGNGKPLLAYHTPDTRNKPLIQVLQASSATGQTFWAERT